jgi:hypothetical protein
VLGLVALVLWFTYNVWRKASSGRQDFIAKASVRATVREVIPVPDRSPSKRMRLSDGSVWYVPTTAVARVHPGDSVVKRPGQSFYTFTDSVSGTRFQAEVGK